MTFAVLIPGSAAGQKPHSLRPHSSEESGVVTDGEVNDRTVHSLHCVRAEDYERLKVVGAGSFAKIYSGIDKRTGAHAALKLLHPNRDDARQRIEYEREVGILGSVCHAAILPLLGCVPFDEPDGPLMVTPLMHCSVQDLIHDEGRGSRPAGWTPTRKHMVLLGIASGMLFMHGKGVIHRDLKPANVLLDDSLEPRIGDVGLSKLIEKGTWISQSVDCGTRPFMAPEFILGDDLTSKIDVYAFGILMFIILTALDPYPDVKHFFILMQRVINVDRSNIPDTVKPLYAELMEPRWSTNPTDSPDFSDILDDLERRSGVRRWFPPKVERPVPGRD
jgi:serine/threonine protein kinase